MLIWYLCGLLAKLGTHMIPTWATCQIRDSYGTYVGYLPNQGLIWYLRGPLAKSGAHMFPTWATCQIRGSCFLHGPHAKSGAHMVPTWATCQINHSHGTYVYIGHLQNQRLIWFLRGPLAKCIKNNKHC